MCVPDVFAYCLETTFVFWVVVVLSLLKINSCDLSIKGSSALLSEDFVFRIYSS